MTGEWVGLVEFLLARIAEDEDAATAWLDVRRKLAECAAKRRIIAVELDRLDALRIPEEVRSRFVNPDGSPVLYALAAVYADHPDYREEWRL